MISVYTVVNDRLEKGGLEALSNAAVWIDLFEPTMEEEAAVEKALQLGVPTREEMQEIEASSRLYKADEAVYVTTPVLTNADSDAPQNTAVTFILSRVCTVTVRYGNPQSFTTFANRAMRQRGLAPTADVVLLGLLETIIDRLADVLERIGGDLDGLSHQIFRTSGNTTDLEAVVRAIGRHGDLASKLRDSLLGVGRIVGFLGPGEEALARKDAKARLKTITRDVRSLTEHAAFVSSKINFLLDATLGMISIQQNNITKLFSVVAVVFLPPTLIATIYGMNFHHMPELDWIGGYPLALLLMLASAVLPYMFFRRKGWL